MQNSTVATLLLLPCLVFGPFGNQEPPAVGQTAAPEIPKAEPRVESNITHLIFVKQGLGCRFLATSADEAVRKLHAGSIPGPWNSWKIETLDQGTVMGFLNTQKFGDVIAPVLLALDREGELQGAYSGIESGLHLRRTLVDLAAGRKTRAEINRRLATNPEDTKALWDLAQMQMACSSLGSSELTLNRIAQLDPERKTLGGEYEKFCRILFAGFSLESIDPAAPLAMIPNLRGQIRELRYREVRCAANDTLALFVAPIGDHDLIRSLLLEAWKDRDPEASDLLAVRIRESSSWPELAALEGTWKEIDAVAAAALR